MIDQYLTVKKITKCQTKQGKKEKKTNITIYFYNDNRARVAQMCSTLYSNASTEQYHTVYCTAIRVSRMIKRSCSISC